MMRLDRHGEPQEPPTEVPAPDPLPPDPEPEGEPV